MKSANILVAMVSRQIMVDLVELGWGEFFARQVPEGTELAPGRVVAEHRTCYRVQTAAGDLAAQISGRLRHSARSRSDLPAVGDWVLLQTGSSEDDATVHQVLERRSKFSRKEAGQRTDEQIVAANIDYVWIVTGLDQDFSLRRIERYLTLAWESGATPVAVLTKSDLVDDAAAYGTQVEQLSPGLPVHVVNALAGQGMEALRFYVRNQSTVALLGSSGVGKSTLVNALAVSSLQETGAVRGDGKGRHTTIHRQLHLLPDGGMIVDSPGMRELQMWDAGDGVAETFGEVEQLAGSCRFADCQHMTEPGCAVREAIESGELSEQRLASYHKLQRELAHLERKQDARAAQQEKQRIRSFTKGIRKHPKFRR